MRKKILKAYLFSKFTLLVFAGVMFVDLHYLNQQIEAGQAVADLRRTALEMRRDEKNLFLYADPASIAHFSSEAKTARTILEEYRETFVKIGGLQEIHKLEALLREYEAAVIAYPAVTDAVAAGASEAIRKQGNELYEITRRLLVTERALLAQATRDASATLLIALIVVVLLELAVGLYLARSVVRPLGELAHGVKQIDAGRSKELALPSNDKEIRIFVESFNTMMRHLHRQQDLTRRNEKAAALGVLVSGVAHELNNPLSNISTSAQLLLEDEDDGNPEQRKQWLQQIDSETERARRIVRRLLDSVRHPRLHKQRLSLGELADSSLELVHRQIPQDVQICVDMQAGQTIEVDRERMHQVFINLIKNAADAGAKHIELHGRAEHWDIEHLRDSLLQGDPTQLNQSSQAVCLRISDDGPGISSALRERIFDPFVTTHASGEGTGLGLYLVEEIVSEHGGCIVLDQRPGGGARFSIWLPQGDIAT